MRPSVLALVVVLTASPAVAGLPFDADTIADVAARVAPWVVHLAVTAARPSGGGPGTWSVWDADSVEGGEGSGLILDRDGHVLTNHHVVEGAGGVAVTFHDGRRFAARVLASDPATDLAVVAIEPSSGDLPLPEAMVAVLGDSDRLRVGQWVVALGSPYRLQRTVTAGIISALGRHIPTSGTRRYNNLIQTDASINPGNSGGPLVALDGRVIGLNAAVRVQGQGLGFAIPVNLARRVADDLVAVGRVRRSWIGISVDPVGPDRARGLGLGRPYGALVTALVPGGPAAAAGLKVGDVLLALDDEEVEHPSGLVEQIQESPVGGTVVVSYLRGGATRTASVVVLEQGAGR